jgi:predicted tellurium resistance membrane protein TerC
MMPELLTVENLFTLMVLTALETVLGFDNLLYFSIEAKRVEEDKQKYVRQVGIVLAIGLRIVLLFGGVFLMYTALKEIFHMLVVHDLQGENGIAVAAR